MSRQVRHARLAGHRARPNHIYPSSIQNPPSIPTLHVAYLLSFALGSSVLVDWHNYGWSILATTRGARHPFVSLYFIYEQFFGRACATSHLTVTDAMAGQLRELGMTGTILTLHDRPPAHFQPIQSVAQRRETLARLKPTSPYADAIMQGTMRLVVSSTSWTPDEDFKLLVDGLVLYASHYEKLHARYETLPGYVPSLLVVVTGRGPQKKMYEAMVRDLALEGRLAGINLLTAWLSTKDYADLLACADIGLCLHTSSSGVDLPMKVVDMFGAGIPVLAYSDYESFAELVKEGINGQGFTTYMELGRCLVHLMSANAKNELASLKAGAIKEGSRRWDEEWDQVVAPELLAI